MILPGAPPFGKSKVSDFWACDKSTKAMSSWMRHTVAMRHRLPFATESASKEAKEDPPSFGNSHMPASGQQMM